jgi:hypothetical protein
MATFNDKITHQWRDAANLVLGIWLALSPAALSYMEHTTPAANGSLVGIVIAVAAAAALISFRMWEEWVNVALGAWLVVSPFVLDYAAHSSPPWLWNQIAVGVLVGGLALWTTTSSPKGGVTT